MAQGRTADGSVGEGSIGEGLLAKAAASEESARPIPAIALSPVLSARYRGRDLERIREAAPGTRLVMVSREGIADGPLDDVEVLLRGFISADAFDRVLAKAPRLAWVHSASAGVENVLDVLRNGIDSALLGLGKGAVQDLGPDDVIVPPGFTRRLGC